jgi:hypothetical protein
MACDPETTTEPPGACCRALLSEGLDLCVRARRMDAIDRREASLVASSDGGEWVKSGAFDRYVARNNTVNPDQPIETRSLTVPLWLQDQYEHDLADWERRARGHLMQGCN